LVEAPARRDASKPEIGERYGGLASFVANGVRRGSVDAIYPLEKYGDALAHGARAGCIGKMLFTW
jgi:hypothetical protein